MKLALRDMLAAGPSAVGRYTGTLLAVFVVQTIVALACMFAIAMVLAAAFANLPMWDEAVDGDLLALVYCLRHGKASVIATSGIVLGAVLLWTVVSWFIVGGIYGVLAQRPEGRAQTARTFGASGASTFLAYARLALCSIPGWIIVLFAFSLGATLVKSWIDTALTVPQLVGPLFVALLPGLLLLHVMWTVTDYARVELTLRHESHEPSAVMTYLRSIVYVVKRPRTLAHAGIGWLAFALISVGYAYLAQGHAMYGSEGAVTLFVIRQGVALARTAIRFGVLAGQLELGKTRALPPGRPEVVKVETKAS